MAQCARLWGRIAGWADGRWGPEFSLVALAAVQRIECSLAAFADTMVSQVQVGLCCSWRGLRLRGRPSAGAV
jgi:hypothetical protein